MNNFSPLSVILKPMLDAECSKDKLFAERVKTTTERADKKKTLDECADYIIGEAYEYAKEHKNGNCGMAGCTEEQIVSMMKHYFDEDDIKIKSIGGAKVSATKVSSAKTESKPKKTPKKEVKAETKKEVKAEPEKPKKPLTKAELKRGDDCYSLFDLMN